MLFNSKRFNTGLFDSGTSNNVVESTDRLSFEGFSLSDGSVIVLTDLLDSGPTREIVGGPVPRDHGMFVNATYFRERTIEARGWIKKSTAAELDAYLDTMREALRAREGNLDLIDANSTVKRFVATVDNYEEMFADRQKYHITICPFVVRFRCFTPFGKARTYSSTSMDITSSPFTQSIVHSGTTQAKLVFTLNFSAASSITALTIENEETGESMSYTGSISAGDILKFDSELLTATKNGAAISYSGSFLTLEPGANLITVTVTGSSFTAYATWKHKTTYL